LAGLPLILTCPQGVNYNLFVRILLPLCCCLLFSWIWFHVL
jgi:hypothetical protein